MLLQDVRHAFRLLRRYPIFAVTAALSIAIGIGANTTIFTIAGALLFKPPAGVVDHARLVDVGRSQNGWGFDNSSYPNYLDIRSRNTVFSGIYSYRFGAEPLSLSGVDPVDPVDHVDRAATASPVAERIFGDMVSLNYFSVLGVRPHIGRLFSPDDPGEPGESDQPGASPFVVLSHRFWTRRFHADPAAVGRTVRLNGQPFTVIGVAPEEFHGTTVMIGDVWVPIAMVSQLSPRRSASILTSRESVWLLMGGRLKPGVSLDRARAELESIGHALEQEFPRENRGKGLRVVASSPIPGNGAPVAGFLAVLMGIVGLVLAVACTNVASVLLARATDRRREIAVRLAIGASRGRLVRQMLIEAVVLFLIGGCAGLGLARILTTLIVSMLPTLPVPLDVSLPLDLRSVAFALGSSLVAALLAGLAPALHGSRAEVIGGLRADGSSGPERQRLRNTFVISQVALSLVLIVMAGLLAQALRRATTIDPGFDMHGVELTALDLSLAGYTPETGRVFARELIQRVRELPGVQSATLSAMVPLGGGGMGLGGVAVPGADQARGQRFAETDWNIVTPGYFSTLKMALVAGRDFTDTDRDGSASVVIVNETAARRWWPSQNALGKTLLQQDGTREQPNRTRTLTVIGVARDSKYRDLGEVPRTFVYVPIAQQYGARTTVVARSTQGQRLAADMRTLMASLDPNLPVVAAQTFEDYASLQLIPQRAAAAVSGSLGIVGILLAAIGIYGVTAYVVSSRTREFGIRMALGAQTREVAELVLRHGMTLAGAGVVLGLLIAAAVSRLLGSLLFGLPAIDPLTFGGSALLFALIALIACYVPARRATRIEAMEALRRE